MIIVIILYGYLAAVVSAEPLLLTPLLRAGRLKEARSLSKVTIDGISMGHSGFFSVPTSTGRNTNHLFFWYQPCLEECHETTPLIHYFNGGPGSPSIANGGMAQIGSWFVHNSTLKPRERCFSWCRKNHCLFVDQPAMTGFSFQTNETGSPNSGSAIEYTKTSSDATEQVYQVLQQVLLVFPHLQPLPYRIQGLSYAGMYVPWMAFTVWQHNLKWEAGGGGSGGGVRVNLVGMAVGDPVMSNAYQYPTYASTLHGMGVVMADERDRLAAIFANATALQQEGQCSASFDEWNSVWGDDGGFSCKPHCKFLFKAMTGSSETENLLLGAEPKEYGTYNHLFLKAHADAFHFEGSPTQMHPQLSEGGLIYETMVQSGDICNASAPLYTTLFLEAGIDVVVYSSTVDPLLGPPTTEAGIQHAWDYAEQAYPGRGAAAKAAYYRQPKTVWAVSEQDYKSSLGPAGYARCLSLDSRSEGGQARRFCYVIVRNAGHETASFQPRAAYDMNERILHRHPFNGSDVTPDLPTCAPCGGVGPFAGSAAAGCRNPGDHDST